MDFKHFIFSIPLLAAVTGFLFYLNVSTMVIASVLVLPAGFLAASYIFDKTMNFSDKANISSKANFTSGNEYYKTAIEPGETWNFVEERIQEKNERGEIHPYRRVNIDPTDPEVNTKSKQRTIKADFGDQKTRLTAIIARPRNMKSGEMVGYVVDLKNPSIADYNSDIKTKEGRHQPFDDFGNFYIKRGESGEPELESEKQHIEINSSKSQKGGA